MPVAVTQTWLTVSGALIGTAASLTVLGVGLHLNSPQVTTAATLLMATVVMAVTWVDRRQSYPLLAFVVCYALFLLGRQGINLALGVPPGQGGILGTGASGPSSMQQTNVALLTGLLGLLAGWLLAPTTGGKTQRPDEERASIVRRAAARLMALALPGALYATWKTVATISTVGFYDGRIEAASAIPLAVRVLQALFHASFFAYLAARPDRRGAALACSIYMTVATLTLATLGRSEFVLSATIVAVYLFHRQSSYGERWFTTRRIGLAMLASPLVLGILNALGTMRGRGQTTTTGAFAPVLDFLRSQGVSVKVVVFGEELAPSIPDDRWYSIGPLLEFSQRVWALVSGTPQPPLSGQTADRAIEGHQLAHTISYLISPGDYLRGTGYGSSYVAELMVDFGLIGVFVGSVIYGLLLMIASSNLKRTIPIAFITLMLLKGAMFVPRASFVQPLVDPFSLPSLVAIIILVAVVQLTRVRRAAPQERRVRRHIESRL